MNIRPALDKASEINLWLLLLCIPLSMVTTLREILTFSALLCTLLMLGLKTRTLYKDRIWIMWGILILLAVISLFYSTDFAYSLSTIRRELGKGLMMFFIGLHIIAQPPALAKTWRVLLLGLVLMSLAGLIISIPSLQHSGWSLAFTRTFRAASLTMDYGHFAAYLAITFPYLLLAPLAFAWRGRARWILWGLALGLALLAAYFTFTRILWLCLPLSALLYGWLMVRRRMRLVLAGAVLAAMALFIFVALPYHSHGEKWENAMEDPSAVGGTAGDLAKIWIFVIEKTKEHPLHGVGFGKLSFLKAYPEFVEATQPLLQHAHNIFADYLVQMGLPGAAALILFLLLLAARLWPHAPPASGDVPGAFRLATLIMMGSYILRSQVDEYFIDEPALLFWLLMGLSLKSRLMPAKATVVK